MRYLTSIGIAILLLLGSWQLVTASWIAIKASLAQQLIEQAWLSTNSQSDIRKPWPWADTWPIAKLNHKEHSYYVLAGASGNALAFGPGHLTGSALPNQQGTSIIAGHRDTHFAFLEALKVGGKLQLTSYVNDAITEQSYEIEQIEIKDSRTDAITAGAGHHELVLVTCYPFDQLRAGGPLRYVVRARLFGQ